MDPPPPDLVKRWPEVGWPVVGFNNLNVRKIPATSTWALALGSKAILPMISGCRLGMVCTLVWLSNWVPARPVRDAGSTTLDPPAEPPMYWSGFSNERPIVTWSFG